MKKILCIPPCVAFLRLCYIVRVAEHKRLGLLMSYIKSLIINSMIQVACVGNIFTKMSRNSPVLNLV